MSTSETRAFYDAFFRSTMLQYRLRGNERLDRAASLILPHVSSVSRILDLGCGIGMTAERMARKARRGHVWATDISEKNIAYARRTVRPSNVSFFVADAVEDFEAVKRHVQEPLDLVTLVDVIEHVPEVVRPRFIQNVASLLRPGGRCILTYPNPANLNSIQEEQPEALQLVDNAVPLAALASEAEAAELTVTYFALASVWKTNDYVHCVLERNPQTLPLPRTPGRVARQAWAGLKRRILLPWRRRRYVKRVGEDWHEDVASD